jgi:phosphoglycerol transferase MdoB-like AlkP superfamily enzyme
MMNSFSSLPFGWHIHWIFISISVIGVVLFIRWAFVALDKNSLKNWSALLIIVGVLGMLLTGLWGLEGMQYMHSGNSNSSWMMEHMMDEDHDFESNEEWREHMLEEMEEHMGLNLNE